MDKPVKGDIEGYGGIWRERGGIDGGTGAIYPGGWIDGGEWG